jgi:hypothetical protein
LDAALAVPMKLTTSAADMRQAMSALIGMCSVCPKKAARTLCGVGVVLAEFASAVRGTRSAEAQRVATFETVAFR